MLIEKIKVFFPIIVLLFLLCGVYIGYANVWFCVIAFVIALTRLNRDEFIFVMLLAGSEYFGAIARIFIGFTIIPQFIVYLIIFIILFQQITPLFKENRKISYLFFSLLILFIISYIYGPQHAYSKTKLTRMLLYGTLCFWTFLIYNRSHDINPQKLAYIFAIVGITYIVIGVSVYHFGTPTSIMDFEYFGRKTFAKTAEDFAISYHSVGLAALYGSVFLLSPGDDKYILKFQSFILMLILIFIALVSQMRQGILGILILLFFRYAILAKIPIHYKIIGIVLLIITSCFIFNDVQTDAFQSLGQARTFEELVNRPYDKAVTIMSEYPLFGKGLGGYSNDGLISYPHNIFLEIINEMGFAGLLAIIIISSSAIRHNNLSLRSLNANGTYTILLLLALFIRVNASGDLSENIYFFSLLFSTENKSFLNENT